MNNEDLCTFLNTITGKPEFLHHWRIFAEADRMAIFEITDCPPGDVGTGVKIRLYRCGILVAAGLSGTDILSKHAAALGPYMLAIEAQTSAKLEEIEVQLTGKA